MEALKSEKRKIFVENVKNAHTCDFFKRFFVK